MSGLHLKQKLASGGTAIGFFLQYTNNPAVVEALPDRGLDFVVVNIEHNSLDMGAFNGMQFALQTKGIACLVRIHNNDPWEVAKACDSFPDGVVIPYAENVEALKRMVAAVRCRPLKGEALERLITRGEWPSEKTRQYVEAKCANTLCCPMIESVKAVENLDAICSIPGVDAVFVGPNDLTVSMGIPEERDSPEFIAMMKTIVDTAAKHGVAAGGHFSQLSHAQRTIRQGGRFIPFSSDVRLISFGVADFLKALGAAQSAGAEKII
jgi:2-keto-3-deoxy-L-rhamnonate aldolase RhmA